MESDGYNMKVLLYTDNFSTVAKSGVGQAMNHQKSAMDCNNFPYTTDSKNDYDIVHINTVFPKSFLMGCSAKLKRKKIVYHAHSTEEDFRNSFKFSNFVSPIVKRWLILCYSMGDIILTPTPYSKKILESYRIKKPIYSVSNGVDLNFFQKEPQARQRFREKYNLSENDKVIMSVGLYIERKGILDFIELAKLMPKYKFIWFGHTDLKTVPKKIRKAVSTKLDNLIFPGFVPQEELKDAYDGSDLFFFPTHEETEGIVVLEALAMKIPVLLRDIPIYEDWLLDGKSVYKANTLEGFQHRITDILEGNIPSLANNGYDQAKARDIRAVGAQLIRCYERVYATNKSYIKLDNY